MCEATVIVPGLPQAPQEERELLPSPSSKYPPFLSKIMGTVGVTLPLGTVSFSSLWILRQASQTKLPKNNNNNNNYKGQLKLRSTETQVESVIMTFRICLQLSPPLTFLLFHWLLWQVSCTSKFTQLSLEQNHEAPLLPVSPQYFYHHVFIVSCVFLLSSDSKLLHFRDSFLLPMEKKYIYMLSIFTSNW